MNIAKLNLARKWRSKNFSEIVGQDLSVRMLKNSLYLQHFFPVYLFSGQRGCGKTTTARVFAAALNCEQLSAFQANPKDVSVPCLACQSCLVMQENKHPDFIEIDAASHTGVDNVRMLIDSASLLPIMGRKKIYLIDEAHMLSKAAFNAFLKIMEEPPASVIFILATTDPQKIIETVRSRCFQLFFTPVEDAKLVDHLKAICESERIPSDVSGLAKIVKETEGSVRDAINLLEQVRFASGRIDHASVSRVLGHMSEENLVKLYELMLLSSPAKLLQFINDLKWQQYSAPAIWDRMFEVTRAALFVKNNVIPDRYASFAADLTRLVSRCTLAQLHAVLDAMIEFEPMFTKTTAKHDVLEMMLLHICYRYHKPDCEGGMSPSSAHAPAVARAEVLPEVEDESGETEDSEDDESEEEDFKKSDLPGQWKEFVTNLAQLSDPLISSIFSQGVPTIFDAEAKRVDATFSKEFVFFKDWLDETAGLWKPIFEKTFGFEVAMNPQFTAMPTISASASARAADPSTATSPHAAHSLSHPLRMNGAGETVVNGIRTVGSPEQRIAQNGRSSRTFLPVGPERAQASRRDQSSNGQSYKNQFTKRAPAVLNPFHAEKSIDISDTSTWKKAHMLLRYIPGTITELRESV